MSVLDTVENESKTPLAKALNLLFGALPEPHIIQNKVGKTDAAAITMDRNLLAKIAMKTQLASERIKEAKSAYK